MTGQKFFIISLLMLVLAGCVQTSLPPKNPYDQFVERIQSENLEEQGIDIISLTDRVIGTTDDIIALEYTIERCNLSKEDMNYLEDMVIRIDIKYDWLDKTLICVFATDESGQYKNILQGKNNYEGTVEYELISILNNGRSQIKLTTQDSSSIRNTEYLIENMQILAYEEEQSKMSIIFNEIITSDAFFPYRQAEEKDDPDKPRILCENEYQFVPVPSGGCDILLNSRICKRESKSGLQDEDSENQREILASGSTRFTYKESCFLPDGEYYDYRLQAQNICDEI